MDFRDGTYAFFGCGQTGGSASGFIFPYNNTSYTQFAGYNYGAGSGAYKSILMDTDSVSRDKGVFVGYDVSTNTPPSSTEFAVRGTGTTSATYCAQFVDDSRTSILIIRNDKRVGIGTAAPSYPLHVALDVSGDSIYASGDIIASSDIRKKTEIQVIENAIEKIKEIRGVTFLKTDTDQTKRKMGVIAQEIKKVAPEAVSTDSEGYLSVAYGNLVGLLIEGIKEQQDQIDNLKQEIEKLKNK
jgi:hypothetical protein